MIMSPASISTQSHWVFPSIARPFTLKFFKLRRRCSAIAPIWRCDVPEAITRKSAISVLPNRSITMVFSALSFSRLTFTWLRI